MLALLTSSVFARTLQPSDWNLSVRPPAPHASLAVSTQINLISTARKASALAAPRAPKRIVLD